MMTRLMLAALFALGAAPALAGDWSNDVKGRPTVTSTDEARTAAAKRIEAQQEAKGAQKSACTCAKHSS